MGFLLVIGILVAALSNHISLTLAQEYDLQPVYLGAVGHYAPLDLYPIAIAIGQDGAVYLIDRFRNRVQKRSVDGTIHSEFALQDSWVRDMEVDAAGNVYTADAVGNVGIRKYDSNGNLIWKIGARGSAPGEFTLPYGLGLDDRGNIYVADKTTQLSAFDSAGNLLWNNKDSVSAEGRLLVPEGVAIGRDNKIYVIDSGDQRHRRVMVFDANGQFLHSWGPSGSGWNFVATVGIAVSSDDMVYVLGRSRLDESIGEDQLWAFTTAGEFRGSWGAKGREPGELWEAEGIAVAPDNTIWVAGYQGHNVVHYDRDGNLLDEWNAHNIQPGEFALTFGAAVGKNGRLYVTDFWNQLVQVFDRYGNFEFMWGERGQAAGPYFNFPRHTAVDHLGNIYVSDDDFIREFNSEGAFLRRSEGLDYACGIEIDDQGRMWVTGRPGIDQGNGNANQIRRFSPAFTLDLIIDGSTVPNGLSDPCGIRQGPNGLLYVVDSGHHRVVRLDQNGNFDMAWGSKGTAPGQFRAPPRGMAIDSRGRVYVSEEWNGRIQVFTQDGVYLTGWAVPGDPAKLVGRVWELTMDGDYFLYAPDHTRTQAEVHKFALIPQVSVAGRPAYTAGVDLGFYVWSNNGTTWRLRWSSDSILHNFAGTVASTTPIVSMTPVNHEPGDDTVHLSTHRIDFSATEARRQDGINFVVEGDGVITFDLRIDDLPQPQLVTIGRVGFVPTSLPLPLSTIVTPAPTPIDPIGQPDYTPAQDAGYFLWQDADDGEWHLRWSGDSPTNLHYVGVVSANRPLSNVRSVRFESNDLLEVDAFALNFNAFAGAGDDGIDFFVPAGTEVTFNLTVNTVAAPQQIHIGRLGASPIAVPFLLVTTPLASSRVSGEVK